MMTHRKTRKNTIHLDSLNARYRPPRGTSTVQRTMVLQVLGQDLKKAISDVKRDHYRRTLAATHDSMALRDVEQRIRIDSQLTQDDRLQLLGEVGSLTAMMGF